MKFLTKLSEALEAPELPEEDRWTDDPYRATISLKNGVQAVRHEIQAFVDEGIIDGWIGYSPGGDYSMLIAGASNADQALNMTGPLTPRDKLTTLIKLMDKGYRVDMQDLLSGAISV